MVSRARAARVDQLSSIGSCDGPDALDLVEVVHDRDQAESGRFRGARLFDDAIENRSGGVVGEREDGRWRPNQGGIESFCGWWTVDRDQPMAGLEAIGTLQPRNSQPRACGARSPGVQVGQPHGVRPPSSGMNAKSQMLCRRVAMPSVARAVAMHPVLCTCSWPPATAVSGRSIGNGLGCLHVDLPSLVAPPLRDRLRRTAVVDPLSPPGQPGRQPPVERGFRLCWASP